MCVTGEFRGLCVLTGPTRSGNNTAPIRLDYASPDTHQLQGLPSGADYASPATTQRQPSTGVAGRIFTLNMICVCVRACVCGLSSCPLDMLGIDIGGILFYAVMPWQWRSCFADYDDLVHPLF